MIAMGLGCVTAYHRGQPTALDVTVRQLGILKT
jgi:hypothetical protein